MCKEINVSLIEIEAIQSHSVFFFKITLKDVILFFADVVAAQEHVCVMHILNYMYLIATLTFLGDMPYAEEARCMMAD